MWDIARFVGECYKLFCKSCEITREITDINNMQLYTCTLFYFSVLAMCVAVILFGIKTSQNHNVQVAFGSTDGNSFGWSFWLGAAAAALSLATSGVYGCASRID